MKHNKARVIPVYVRREGKFRMAISQDKYRQHCSNGYITATATLDMLQQGVVPEGCTKVLILRKGVRALAAAADWTDVVPTEKEGV